MSGHDAARVEPLRVMLVGSDGEVLEALRRALAAPPFVLVAEAWPGIDAIRRAAEDPADVILVHVEPPVGPAARTLQALAAAAPAAGVAAVSSASELELVRRLMNAGADDFATLPLTDAAIQDVARRARAAATQRAVAHEQGPQPHGRVITIAGPRGGVGKTTLATNLAIAIASGREVSVVLADLDVLFGGAAIAFGLVPRTGVQEWLQARGTEPTPAHRYLEAHRSGVRLLAAPAEPDARLDFGVPEAAALIEDLASTHDFVIVDTPAGFGPVTGAAVDLASTVLLMTTPDIASLRAVRYVVSTLHGWGFDDERLRLVRNHPVRTRGARDGELAEAVGLPVGWSLPHDAAVTRSSDLGSPICEARPQNRFAREIAQMARYEAEGERATRRRRWLGVASWP